MPKNMSENAKESRTITLDELLFVNIPSPARAAVIEASVTIERVITTMLAMFLNIDIENSKSFSKSGLSFNSKLNLLADINMIDKEEKSKLIKFSEIRNIFAHDNKVFMFNQCFKENDLKAFLLKRYGEQKSTYDFEEENDQLLFNKLFEDIKAICRKLFAKMMEKATDSGRQTGIIEFFLNLQSILARLSEADTAFAAIIDKAYEQAKKEWNDKNS
jgi:hypothetical protein